MRINVLEVVAPGPQGPPGPAGPGGPAGPAGGQYYVHEQATPATPWTVIHGFGVKPSSVSVLDLNDNLVEAEYQHVSTNQLQVRPLLPATGRVIVGG